MRTIMLMGMSMGLSILLFVVVYGWVATNKYTDADDWGRKYRWLWVLICLIGWGCAGVTSYAVNLPKTNLSTPSRRGGGMY